MPVLLAIVAFAVVLFLGILAGTALGALAGWVVGLVFSDTMIRLATMIGQPDMPAWQIGAILGFVGGFFRSSMTTGK